ncbi:MAG: hypothetical protein KAH72_02000, partial [Flavobacteriaceae bacterium]|nr:hypothetical protein [Flavobacteriaceae bacterium]
MRTNAFIWVLIFLTINVMSAQVEDKESLPYYEISDYPENYNQGTVVARMIDGLGFRYYWTTEGLRDEDLKFKPNNEARTTEETIDHILGLSNIIVNSTLNKVNEKTDYTGLTFAQKRKKTLENLKIAADILRKSEDISQFKIIFKGENGVTEYPFWNQINGPIEDAIWHCGQVVSFRRSSGNPYNSKASVFTGKVRD